MPNGKGYTITYDGVASTSIPEFICHSIRRQLVGERRHTIEKVAGMPGGWLFPEQAGTRLIEIEASVLADSWPADRREAVRAVANWLDKDSFKKLILGDDPAVYNMAILNEAPQIDEWRDLGSFTFAMLAMPYTYALAISEVTDSSLSASDTVVIPVLGDVYTEPIIEVTAPGGGISSVQITLNGRQLVYSTAITSANKININCISKTVHTGAIADTDLQGTFNPATLSMATVSGQFPYLLPGNNNLSIVSATGAAVKVQWRDRYR